MLRNSLARVYLPLSVASRNRGAKVQDAWLSEAIVGRYHKR
jgi:hypothetical protein